jgi:hypothetical protein
MSRWNFKSQISHFKMKDETKAKVKYWASGLFALTALGLLAVGSVVLGVIDVMARWRIAFGHFK